MTHDLLKKIEPLPPTEPTSPDSSHGELSGETPGPESRGSSRASRSRGRWIAAVCGFILLAIGLVFGQTIGHEFVNFDDELYVSENPQVMRGLTVPGITAAFSDHAYYHWQPLAVLSHMLDCQLYGLNPSGHHLTSVLLHAATAISLFLVLLGMTGDFWPSAFVAAVFAVHPLRAESVAWVSERKDVLSGLFFMLTVGAYASYTRRRSWARYLLVMVLFGLGLMSKAMIVTLPVVLLLLDYWPLGRLGARGLRPEDSLHVTSTLKPQVSSLLAEKIPLALLAATVCVVTLATQRSGIQTNDQFPTGVRTGNALVAYVSYLGKLLYPLGLAAYYPHPGSSLPLWKVVGAALVLAAITAGVVIWRRRCPYLLVGWLWYLVMLLPVSQLVQLGGYGMADRYTYLPQIGLVIALAWGAAQLSRSWLYWMTGRSARLTTWITGAAAALTIACLMRCAWRQTSYWQNSAALWTHTLACTSDNALAHNHFANALMAQGKTDEALAHYQQAAYIEEHVHHFNSRFADPLSNMSAVELQRGKVDQAIAHCRQAIELQPNFAVAHSNLANALMAKGEIEEAIQHYQRAIEIHPVYSHAHNNLAGALMERGKVDEAMAHYRKAVEIDPGYAEAHYNLAATLTGERKFDEAVEQYEKALEINPRFGKAHNNLANTLMSQGKLDEAIAHYEQALAIEPTYADAHFNLGVTLSRQAKTLAAVSHWREAARLQPNHAVILYRLAWVLATSEDESIRNGPKAVELADRAVQLSGGQDPALLDALAAAYAETGQFGRAVQIAAQGRTLAEAQNNPILAAGLRQRINRYRAGLPYRDTAVRQ